MTESSYEYDLIIVGAGIHGASIAHEASLKGIQTLLIEQFAERCTPMVVN